MAVIGAGTAVYQQRQAVKAADRQQEAENENTRLAATQQTNERLKEAREQRASARAAAAEASIGGNSLGALEMDIEAQAGRDVTTIEGNARRSGIAANTQYRSQVRAANAEAVSSIASSAASSAGSAYKNYTIKKGD